MSDGSAAASDVAACAHLDLAAMREELELEEGRVHHAYKDSLGYLTIGVGRLIDERHGGGLTNDEIDLLLTNDIARHADELARRWPAFLAIAATEPVRARGILNMVFQLGVSGFLGFHNSVAYLERRQWSLAATCMRESLWAKQTPARAARVLWLIANGAPMPRAGRPSP
jgi:lysozyme